MCPQSVQTETLQPSFPDLQAIMEEAAFIWTGEGLKEAAYFFQALSKTCWILSLCIVFSSHFVKGADSATGAIVCQMDIDDSGMDRLMSQKRFYGEQVGAVLVKVCAKSMAERVAGDAQGPAQAALMFMDVPGKEEGVDWLVPARLLWEEIPPGTAAGKPVLCQDVKGGL